MSGLLAPSDEAGVAPAGTQAGGGGEAAAGAGQCEKPGQPLLVLGNGTKSGMLRPVQAARSLSSRNLTGITLYSPNELIISARAGTPLAEIEATLAEQRQH